MVTWHQATPPPAGVTYEWVGEPHKSESIKRVDGVEVARNYQTSPSKAENLSFRITRDVNVARGDGPDGLRGLFTVTDLPGTPYIGYSNPDVRPGQWVALAANLAWGEGVGTARYQVQFHGDSGAIESPQTYYYKSENPENGRFWGVGQAPEGTINARPFVWWYGEDHRDDAVAGETIWMDYFSLAIADTEAEALAQVETYFDGSFEDDREGDIWINSSTGAFYSWGGASRGWVARDDDKANHLLGDNRLDTSYLTSPHGGSAGDHRGYFEGRWSHPGGDDSIIRTIDTYRLEQYPYVYPSLRVVVEGGVTKLSDGRDPLLLLRPSLDDPRNVGARAGHHIKVTPGEEMVFKTGLSYSWSDTSMFRSEGVQLTIGLADINGSWKATRFSPTVSAIGLNSEPAPLEYTFTVPDGVEWAYVVVNIVAPAQTRTGPGALYLTDLYFGTTNPSRSGAAEVGVATVDRRGLVSETFARSREKIDLQLAEPDEELLGGERVELAAFAASSSEVTWRWRQITGPEVFLVREGNTCHFQAPDVSTETDVRIAVSASSVDGANRSDWHFFDLEILPTVGRFAAPGGNFEPYTPQMVGYDRGKREIWNDVIAPVGMDPEGRKEPKLVDLGIPADDVTFSLDGEEPARASAGAVYVDIRDGAIYRNFGDGYNETDDTTGAPRRNAYMVNPATGEVFEWIEGADNGR